MVLRSRRPPSRFCIYRNPLSDTWRVDLSVPVVDPEGSSGHAYVGTLKRTSAPNRDVTYEGPIQALESSVLCRDLQFARGYLGHNEPVYLVLS